MYSMLKRLAFLFLFCQIIPLIATVSTIETATTKNPASIPLAAIPVNPANNALHVNEHISLSWALNQSSPAAAGFRMNLGTDNPPTNLLENQDMGLVTSYAPLFAYNTTYYWQIIVWIIVL
jgi:hypothetical protein